METSRSIGEHPDCGRYAVVEANKVGEMSDEVPSVCKELPNPDELAEVSCRQGEVSV